MADLVQDISEEGNAHIMVEIIADQPAVDVRCLLSHIVG